MVAATLKDRKAPTRFSTPGDGDRDLRRERSGGDGGRHRVAGVVEAVGEVEGKGSNHHKCQQSVTIHIVQPAGSAHLEPAALFSGPTPMPVFAICSPRSRNRALIGASGESRVPWQRSPLRPARTATARPQAGMRRDVGLVGLTFTSLGCVIGSGWLLAALEASSVAGPAAILAWGIGGVIVLALAWSTPSSAPPIRSPAAPLGSPTSRSGPIAGFASGWLAWLGHGHARADRGRGGAAVPDAQDALR